MSTVQTATVNQIGWARRRQKRTGKAVEVFLDSVG